MKTKQELAGIYVASITAYDQAGNVDAAALQKLMQQQHQRGRCRLLCGRQQRRVLYADRSRARAGV